MRNPWSSFVSNLSLLLLAVLALAMALPANGAIRYDQRFYEISGEVVTPHIPWGNPLAGGGIRILVIAPRVTMRDVVELAQRLEVEHDEVMTWSSGVLGSRRDMRMYNQAEGAMVEDVEAELREKLEQPCDVILVGDLQWNILPPDVQDAILAKTRQGGGLIYAHPPKGWVENAGIEGLEEIREERPFLSRGIPFEALSAFEKFRGSADPVAEFAALYRLGKGRLAVLEYPRSSGVACLTAAPTAWGEHPELEYEYLQSFAIKVILWAAGKVPAVSIQSIAVSPKVVRWEEQGRVRLQLELETRAEKQPVEIQWAIRDDLGPPRAEGSLTATLERGSKSFSIPLPRTPSGSHLVDVTIASDRGNLNWGSVRFRVESAFGIDSVSTSKPYYEDSEAISGAVALRGSMPAGAVLRVRLVDHLGRILAEQSGPPADHQLFDFAMDDPQSSVYRVEAAILSGEMLVQAKSAEFPVRRLNDNDFTFWMWPGRGSAYDHTTQIVLEQLAGIGVDGFSNVYAPSDDYLRNFARHNFFLIPYMTRYFYSGRGDPDTIDVRKPCLTDPEYREKEAEHLRKNARAFVPYGPPIYTLGDENELGSDYKDICFSETCRADFRAYLKKTYGTLEALNQEWGTRLADWEEVEPIRLEEATALGQIPRWVDHRQHMEKVFLDMHLFATGVIREIDPAARVGFDGAWYTTSWVGYDFWDLMNHLDFMGVYFPPEQLEQIRSFRRPGTSIGTWYGGYVWGGFGAYGMFKYAPQRREDFQRYWPWHLLLNGCDGAWWFNSFSNNECAIAPDLSFYPIFRYTMEEVNEIKSGVDRLLLSSERLDDGIAIHYSETNTHASTVAHALTSTSASQRSFIKLLEDLGFQYRYLAAPQIAGGVLQKEGYRLLVLPYAQSLSSAEVAAIKDFVRGGGVVLADLRPGVFDEHGRALRRGGLDEVFGIERRSSEWTDRVRAGLADDGFGGVLPGSRVDSEVRLKGGEALGRWGEVPFCIARKVGQGQALLLNFSLDPYFELRKQAGEERFDRFFRSLLADLGIRPRVQVLYEETPLRAQEVVTFQDGDLEYVAIKRDAEVVEVESQRVNVLFPHRAHLYDVREGTYLGYGRRARAVLSRVTPRIFSLLPYHVEEVKIELDQEICHPGDRVGVRVDLKTSTERVGNHVIRLEVRTPSGEISRPLSRTLSAPGGRAEGGLTLALNDPPGSWTIEVRDVATGGKATAILEVEK